MTLPQVGTNQRATPPAAPMMLTPCPYDPITGGYEPTGDDLEYAIHRLDQVCTCEYKPFIALIRYAHVNISTP